MYLKFCFKSPLGFRHRFSFTNISKTKDWALVQTVAFVLEIKMLMFDLVNQLNFNLYFNRSGPTQYDITKPNLIYPKLILYPLGYQPWALPTWATRPGYPKSFLKSKGYFKVLSFFSFCFP